MHGLATLARRLEAIARRLGAVVEPETPAQTSRRLVLCRMALAGETPGDLTEGERLRFPKIVATVLVALEIQAEGLVGPDGEPSGSDDLDLRHEDGNDFGEQRYSVGWPHDRPERKGPRVPSIWELEGWLTSQDVAAKLGISREDVRELLKSETLVPDRSRVVKTRLGWLVHPGELDRLVSLRSGKTKGDA